MRRLSILIFLGSALASGPVHAQNEFTVGRKVAEMPSTELKHLLRQYPTAIAAYDKPNGFSLIHYAAMCGSQGSHIPLLLEMGASPNAESYEGITPLDVATQMDCVIPTLELIKAGAKLGANGPTGGTRLHSWAVGAGNSDVLEALLSKDLEVDAKTTLGQTPLHLWAGTNSKHSVGSMLIDAGADIEAREGHGRTALLVAVALGNFNAVDTLLQLGADPLTTDDFGVTALGWTQSDYIIGQEKRQGRRFRRNMERMRDRLRHAKVAVGNPIIASNYADGDAVNVALETYKASWKPGQTAKVLPVGPHHSETNSPNLSAKCGNPNLVGINRETYEENRRAIRSELRRKGAFSVSGTCVQTVTSASQIIDGITKLDVAIIVGDKTHEFQIEVAFD